MSPWLISVLAFAVAGNMTGTQEPTTPYGVKLIEIDGRKTAVCGVVTFIYSLQ